MGFIRHGAKNLSVFRVAHGFSAARPLVRQAPEAKQKKSLENL